MEPIKVKVVNEGPHALPKYQTAQSAGMDVHAWIAEGSLKIAAGERVKVRTGLKIEIPNGYEMQLRPRSGLAYRNGISLINSPGTIDADYRGEIEILLINHGQEAVSLADGERIAQMVLCPVVQGQWEEQSTLNESERGVGGFGSTGLR